jgi:tetratricopeptide (TPR) repeat protein
VARALAAALDDWAGERRRYRPHDDDAWKRLVDTARAADPDPDRDRLRVLWTEPPGPSRRDRLEKLAREVEPRGWPPASLNLLAGALSESGARPAAADLLRRAQAVHPGDVWINHDLGRALEGLHPSRSEAAIGYFNAARALRPETAHELAHALEVRGRDAEARLIFEDLTRLRAASGRHWHCLGQLLLRGGDLDAALAALEKSAAALRAAIHAHPDDFQSHYVLGSSLEAQHKVTEAVAEYRAAVRIQPDSAAARDNLGSVLLTQSRVNEAIAELRQSIRLGPDFAAPHHNLGLALGVQGKYVDAMAEFREAIRLDGELVGEAPFALALTLRRLGRYGEAIDHYRRLLERVRDNPRLQPRVAAELASAERQAALALRLPAVLRGDDRPKDAAERLDFARVAYQARQFAASARLYSESFREDPRQADDMAAQYRYMAAWSAALAAAGDGGAGPSLDAPARARWRKQALDWLRADLAYGKQLMPTGLPVVKEVVNLRLRRWRAEPDLAGVRDEAALNALPETQRRPWRDFWAEVDALIEATSSSADRPSASPAGGRGPSPSGPDRTARRPRQPIGSPVVSGSRRRSGPFTDPARPIASGSRLPQPIRPVPVVDGDESVFLLPSHDRAACPAGVVLPNLLGAERQTMSVVTRRRRTHTPATRPVSLRSTASRPPSIGLATPRASDTMTQVRAFRHSWQGVTACVSGISTASAASPAT